MPQLDAITFATLAEHGLDVTLGSAEIVENISERVGHVIDDDIATMLHTLATSVVVDVRTPGEFARAHVPGALNIPLFSDEERIVIGTLYKQSGRSAAIDAGWSYVKPRLDDVVAKIRAVASDTHTIIHCARGGLRSRSVAWLLAHAGVEVTTLRHGYKSARRAVLATFEKRYDFRVLSGHTGCGKTDVLRELAKRGAQVVDLEALANHKGSSFGALGERAQPSSEMFENMLAMKLAEFDASKAIWFEDESMRIGSCAIPGTIYAAMRSAPVAKLEIPAAARLSYSVNNYGQHDIADLKAAIVRVTKRLGGLRVKEALQFLDRGQIVDAAAIMLQYYDQSYAYGLAKRRSDTVLVIAAPSTDAKANADAVLAAMNAR
jgi:tRNA 2-selenouridine synthase